MRLVIHPVGQTSGAESPFETESSGAIRLATHCTNAPRFPAHDPSSPSGVRRRGRELLVPGDHPRRPQPRSATHVRGGGPCGQPTHSHTLRKNAAAAWLETRRMHGARRCRHRAIDTQRRAGPGVCQIHRRSPVNACTVDGTKIPFKQPGGGCQTRFHRRRQSVKTAARPKNTSLT